MDRYRSTHGNPYPSYQDRILDTVVDFGYLAPRILAREEELEKMFHDCALDAQLVATDAAVTRRPLVNVIRRRLAEIFIVIETRLQGTPSKTGGDGADCEAPWSAAITEAR